MVRGLAQGAQAHPAYVFANRRADRLKVLVYDGAGMWLCTRRLQAGGFAWPHEASATQTCEAQSADDAVLIARLALERMHAQLKFQQTKIEALNFELARLERWRFGSSAETLETCTQAVLFDCIVVDTALEDRAAQEQTKPPPPAAPPAPAKRKPVRQALPARLPRIDQHHEIERTHCACATSSSATA